MFVYEFPPPIFLFLAPFSQRWSWFLDQLQLLIDFQKELPVLRNLLPQVRKLFIHPSPESLHYESTENGVLTTRKIQLRPQQLSWKTFSSTYNVRKERNCKPNTIIGYMLEIASNHKGWSTSNTLINDNSKLQKWIKEFYHSEPNVRPLFLNQNLLLDLIKPFRPNEPCYIVKFLTWKIVLYVALSTALRIS